MVKEFKAGRHYRALVTDAYRKRDTIYKAESNTCSSSLWFITTNDGVLSSGMKEKWEEVNKQTYKIH